MLRALTIGLLLCHFSSGTKHHLQDMKNLKINGKDPAATRAPGSGKLPKNMPKFDKETVMKRMKKELKQKDRPSTPWPRNFIMKVANSEPGFKLTETLLFDFSSNKIRTQTHYAFLGLEEQLALDVIYNEADSFIAVQSEQDCLWRDTMWVSMTPVEIFFQMFHGLTTWKGKDPETGEHILELADFIMGGSADTTKFEFLFTDTKPAVISAMRLTAPKIGTRRWDVIKAPDYDEEEVDEYEDFEKRKGCKKGSEDDIKEGFGFVSFTRHLIEQLSGKEKEMIKHLEEKYDVEPMEQDEEPKDEQINENENKGDQEVQEKEVLKEEENTVNDVKDPEPAEQTKEEPIVDQNAQQEQAKEEKPEEASQQEEKQEKKTEGKKQKKKGKGGKKNDL